MLQGSLDDFALDEVLGLLASTSKSGRLRLSGDRGTGSLWLDQGGLTAAEASKIPGKTGVEDVMFEMLRFDEGTFSFMVDDVPAQPGSAEQVSSVVEIAQNRLAEWRDIESVVPSLAHIVRLAGRLPEEEILVSSDEWQTLLAVGNEAAVEPICDQLGVDEVDGCRRIKQMVERGMLLISDPDGSEAVATSDEDTTVGQKQQPDAASPSLSMASDLTTIGQSADLADERPPMPAPPSPAEIQSFSSDLAQNSPFENGELLDESLVGPKDEGESVLMRYLQSDH